MTAPNSEMQRIEASWNQLVDLVNQGHGPRRLTKVGAGGWAVKDHLAHIGAWEHSLLALIEGRDRPSAMGLTEPSEEGDAINEAVRKLHEGDTPEEALGYFRDSHAQLIGALGKLSDADLEKPYSHYQPT